MPTLLLKRRPFMASGSTTERLDRRLHRAASQLRQRLHINTPATALFEFQQQRFAFTRFAAGITSRSNDCIQWFMARRPSMNAPWPGACELASALPNVRLLNLQEVDHE